MRRLRVTVGRRTNDGGSACRVQQGADRVGSIRWKAGSAGIGFSERTSGRDCIGRDGRGQAVDTIDPPDLVVPSVPKWVYGLCRGNPVRGSIFFRDKRHRPVFLTLEISARCLVNVCLF